MAEYDGMSEFREDSLREEYRRIKKLSEFDLDLYELRDEFKGLMELAGNIAGTEVSVVNLIDNYSQWTLSAVDKDPKRLARENSICTHTIATNAYLEVLRLDLDERFKDKSYVAAEESYRYYLGMPLTLSSGENVGALCMLDTKQQDIGEEKKQMLAIIAKEIVHKLEQRKKLNEALHKLSEAVRVKNQIAHDIRGPVHGIAGLAESVEDEHLSIDEMREYFMLIKDSGTSIIELTDEILNSADIAGMLSPRKITLLDLQQKLLQLYELPAKSKNLSLIILTNSSRGEQKFNKRRVLSIFGNLISNSIKFTKEGGSIEVHMDILSSENGKFLNVLVQDNGVGMSEKVLHNYLQEISVQSLGTGGERGFGLGLKLVKELVNELDGTMEISSKEDAGTKTRIQIPIN